MGQPRRVAIFDFSDPLLSPMAPLAILSVVGGFMLLLSAILFIVVLVRSHFGDVVMREPLRYALAVNPPVRVPVALNGFALWNVILLLISHVSKLMRGSTTKLSELFGSTDGRQRNALLQVRPNGWR
jgi:cytochrome c oxidase subunit 1